MASPAEIDSKPPVQVGYPAASGGPPPQQPMPPPLHSGYPPPYSGYPPPYPGYPDPSTHHFHQSMPPPNPAYYTSPPLPYIYPEQRRRYSFARVVLCMMIVLIIGTTAMSLLTWAIFGSNIPRFQVDSLSVPSFEISNKTLKAVWAANVTIINPNKKLSTSLDHIESRLVYKESLVDTSMIEPLHLGPNDQRTMGTTFAVPTPAYSTTEAYWLEDMENDRRAGSVVFHLRFIMAATFSSGDVWRRQTILTALCEDLQVQFTDPTGPGKWNGNKQECFLLV